VTDDLAVTASVFIGALPASVELPAGTGKTHLLAATACQLADADSRVLILTHTNAGVHAIRRRLVDLGVSRGCTISTIASFAFSLVRPYPQLAGLEVTDYPVPEDSAAYVQAATRVASARHIQRVIAASFSHLLVDEYQDCSLDQHAFICAIASAVPAAGVLGDPMQAIFGFAEPLVPWTEVLARFPNHPVPLQPWRWNTYNDELGVWLLSIRDQLRAGEMFDFSRALPPGVSFQTITPANHRDALMRFRWQTWPNGETVLVLSGPSANQTRAAAITMGGTFSAMEEMAGVFMRAFLDELVVLDPSQYAAWLLNVTKKCFCGHGKLNSPVAKRVTAGRTVGDLQREGLEPVLRALDTVTERRSLSSLAAAMDIVRTASALALHSHEAWFDMQTAIRGAAAASNPRAITDELTKARDRVRHVGRRTRARVVSRTLLVKGLEYDHVIIADLSAISDQHNLYVALSRARKTITILGHTPRLLVKPTALKPGAEERPALGLRRRPA
jgi:hypothetical protein